ncbi:equatorin [Tenrec ecaudatus]|uniref:equatorin n=1 Tax=Tenrec ecaudatus TaxID=94439 RepID=UPI003F5918FA
MFLYTFTTQNINGTGPEISLRATTDINFLLKNSPTNTETSTTNPPESVDEKPPESIDEKPPESVDENPPESVDEKPPESVTEKPPEEPTAEENHVVEDHDNHLKKPTKSQNEPEFWTMLEKDSDLNPPGEIVGAIQDIKLRLMLGVSLMSLFLFLILLTLCFITMYRLRKLSKQEGDAKYSVNPNLAQMSYFRPSEGVSDTSFSKSAASSTFWANSPSEINKLGPKQEKSKTMVDTVPPAPEDAERLEAVGANEEQNVEMLP